jgi:hypothetical protein
MTLSLEQPRVILIAQRREQTNFNNNTDNKRQRNFNNNTDNRRQRGVDHNPTHTGSRFNGGKKDVCGTQEFLRNPICFYNFISSGENGSCLFNSKEELGLCLLIFERATVASMS